MAAVNPIAPFNLGKFLAALMKAYRAAYVGAAQVGGRVGVGTAGGIKGALLKSVMSTGAKKATPNIMGSLIAKGKISEKEMGLFLEMIKKGTFK